MAADRNTTNIINAITCKLVIQYVSQFITCLKPIHHIFLCCCGSWKSYLYILSIKRNYLFVENNLHEKARLLSRVGGRGSELSSQMWDVVHSRGWIYASRTTTLTVSGVGRSECTLCQNLGLAKQVKKPASVTKSYLSSLYHDAMEFNHSITDQHKLLAFLLPCT